MITARLLIMSEAHNRQACLLLPTKTVWCFTPLDPEEALLADVTRENTARPYDILAYSPPDFYPKKDERLRQEILFKR
jgi:hypothetical protein